MSAQPVDEFIEAPQPARKYDWERVVRRVSMPAGVKGLAFVLASYADGDGTRIHPSNARLANVMERSEKTIERGMKWLVSTGFVVITRHKNGQAGIANEYRLTLPADVVYRMALDPDEKPIALPDMGVG
ncbi:helix-turn-helix domain-containing protein [Rhodococcus oryzae]|uniref:helix-turn-helix domain-containing protein n=1 Tax=Rhodococcus oryzae TaxID=2571143 RepID=UPI003710A883